MVLEPLSNGGGYYNSVPESYVLPMHQRPGSTTPSSAAAIPVVDLAGDDQDKIANQIMDAGREFGFVQVIIHFISKLPISIAWFGYH